MDQYNNWARPGEFFSVLKALDKEMEKYVSRILDREPEIAGFSIHGANLLFSVEMARRLKQKRQDIRIIFGGTACFHFEKGRPIPSSFYDHQTGDCLIYPGLIDAFVKGEGEETLLELMEVYSRGGEIQSIPGAVGYAQGGYGPFQPRALIRDLDRIPFPTFRGFSLNKYTSKRLPLLMSRGCVRRCSFCNDWRISGQEYRSRSPWHLEEEIRHHYDKYGVGEFHFCDLLINGDLKILDQTCGLLMDLPYPVSWSAQAAVHPGMTGELMKKMRKAGCVCLVYGVESFSDTVLKKMNKSYDRKDIEHVLKITHDSGIQTWINIIAGFPGEGENEFQDSVDFLSKNSRYIDKVSSLSPCYVTGNSDLEMLPDRFGIDLPDKDWWYLWTDRDNNNYSRRKARTEKLHSLLESLDIPVEFIGIYDTEKKEKWRRFLQKIF